MYQALEWPRYFRCIGMHVNTVLPGANKDALPSGTTCLDSLLTTRAEFIKFADRNMRWQKHCKNCVPANVEGRTNRPALLVRKGGDPVVGGHVVHLHIIQVSAGA